MFNIANGQVKLNDQIPEIAINSCLSVQSDVPFLISSNSPTPATTIIDPKEVGHNIFILAHQLSRHNEELAAMMTPENAKDKSTVEALTFYREHTAQIEVCLNN